MLRQLRVGNLALVEDLNLSLDVGLTVLTGETGAGKSLVAGALSLLAGGKGEKDQIRRGEDLAYVEGVFDLGDCPEQMAFCQELGIKVADDGLLVLRRELRRESRGRVLINGLMSSLALLEQVGPRLVGVQSQDQQRVLSRAGFARDFLDRALGLDEELAAVGRHLAQFQEWNRLLARRRQEEDFARQQLEIWEYQLKELSEAGLDADEEADLAEKIAMGRNSRSLLESAAQAREALTEGEVNARDLLGSAFGALAPLEDTSPRLAAILELVQTAQSAAEEAAGGLERFLDTVDVDPSRLDEWEERHALYGELKRKYQTDVAGLLEREATLADQVARQRAAASDILQLEDDVHSARETLAQACWVLRERRVEGAPQVARQARDLIRPLAMPDVDLAFAVEPDLDPHGAISVDGQSSRVTGVGADLVSLVARTNPGESYGEVGKIASGGEKSRIFLGLSVLDRHESEPPLMLFDEIDAGLGMDNAVPVARLLSRLGENGQVLCITHLPTVAAFGQWHWKVAKEVAHKRTRVRVVKLDAEGRVEEIARLLGGQMSGDATRPVQIDHARKLLGQDRMDRQQGSG